MKAIFAKYKMWLILVLIVSFFIGIFTLNTSDSRKAIQGLKMSGSKELVLKNWDTWITKIDSKGGTEKYIKAVKAKLAAHELSDTEITEWHKRFRLYMDAKPSMNVIVIPDLSNRVALIPDTDKYDQEIIEGVYKTFFDIAKKNKSQDQLTLEVTDDGQARGAYKKLASDLSIDLTNRKNETALNYLQNKEANFKNNLRLLYQEALKQPSAADYFYYFKRVLPNKIKKSDINTEYINKIIILTDGYLETKGKDYTKIPPSLKSAADIKAIETIMEANNLKIPSLGYKLPNTEILVLEVTERSAGLMWHKEILEKYWRDWFLDMGVSNVKNGRDFFKIHNNNGEQTNKLVNAFLQNNN